MGNSCSGFIIITGGVENFWKILLQELTLPIRIIAKQKVYYRFVWFHSKYVQKV